MILLPPPLTPLHTSNPAHAVLDKQLARRLQLGLGQPQVVDSAEAQNRAFGKRRANAIHEGTAGFAEVACHAVA